MHVAIVDGPAFFAGFRRYAQYRGPQRAGARDDRGGTGRSRRKRPFICV
jgi:hypothetical protein